MKSNSFFHSGSSIAANMETKMEPIPEYGDLMTMKEFEECVESGGFIDYDGSGNYSDGKQMISISVYPSDVSAVDILPRMNSWNSCGPDLHPSHGGPSASSPTGSNISICVSRSRRRAPPPLSVLFSLLVLSSERIFSEQPHTNISMNFGESGLVLAAASRSKDRKENAKGQFIPRLKPVAFLGGTRKHDKTWGFVVWFNK